MSEENLPRKVASAIGFVANPHSKEFWLGVGYSIAALIVLTSFTGVLPSDVTLTKQSEQMTVTVGDFQSSKIRCIEKDSLLYEKTFNCESEPEDYDETWQIQNPDFSFDASNGRDNEKIIFSITDNQKRNQIETSEITEGTTLSLSNLKIEVTQINGASVSFKIAHISQPKIVLRASFVALIIIAGLAALSYNLSRAYRKYTERSQE